MPTAHLANGEDWLARLAALSDRSRVRLMRVLEKEELGVGELSRILGMPQSTVSRHLKPLYELQLVTKRTEGTASLYRINMNDAADSHLWKTTTERLGDAEDFADDAARLRKVLLERRSDSRSFFGRVGSEWQSIRRELFGFGFSDDALLSLIHSNSTVADLGCGTGDASERLAPVVSRVYAIDREPSMLTAARRRLEMYDNIEFLEADLTNLPLEDGSIDIVVVMLVLHHQEQPEAILSEAARVLGEKGQLLIVDMVSHDRTEFAEEMGHAHLGFDEAMVSEWASRCGLRISQYRRLRPSTAGRGPALFSATLVR